MTRRIFKGNKVARYSQSSIMALPSAQLLKHHQSHATTGILKILNLVLMANKQAANGQLLCRNNDTSRATLCEGLSYTAVELRLTKYSIIHFDFNNIKQR